MRYVCQRVLGRRDLLASAVSLIPAVGLLRAQQPQRVPTFSSGVRVVNVFATVRDKKGQIVRGLTKDDFILEEDGRPQTIRYFSQESDLPLTLGLLVDTSMSERRMLGTESEASRAFLEQVLRPATDKAFLIHFDHEVELLQDLTSSRERLERALDEINRPEFAQSGRAQSGGGYGGRRGGMGGRRGGGTTLFDAIYLASDELMKKQTGRKAIILLTDGEDNASKVSLAEAISAAQRADTLAYSVRVADQEENFQGFPSPGMGRHGGWGGRNGGYGRGPIAAERPDGKKILQQISRETGGAYFEVSKKKTVEDIYKEVQQDLRNQYSLGYTSDRPDTEPGYRKIQLKAKRKDVTVQARDGYYAGAA